MEPLTQSVPTARPDWAAGIISCLAAAVLIAASAVKCMQPAPVVEAFVRVGYWVMAAPGGAARPAAAARSDIPGTNTYGKED